MWCAVAFLLFLSAMWGLSDTSYRTAFDDPSFAVVFWPALGSAALITTLVAIAWRQLSGGALLSRPGAPPDNQANKEKEEIYPGLPPLPPSSPPPPPKPR